MNGGYCIRAVSPQDEDSILHIYNSNVEFLCRHLALASVDAGFLRGEQTAMKEAGFLSCVVEDGAGEIAGVLDYQPGETVYLSLLMLDGQRRGCGSGEAIYRQFEAAVAEQGTRAIRIDVVDDYPGNAMPFWIRQGFAARERVELEWGEKRSAAALMTKTICNGEK